VFFLVFLVLLHGRIPIFFSDEFNAATGSRTAEDGKYEYISPRPCLHRDGRKLFHLCEESDAQRDRLHTDSQCASNSVVVLSSGLEKCLEPSGSVGTEGLSSESAVSHSKSSTTTRSLGKDVLKEADSLVACFQWDERKLEIKCNLKSLYCSDVQRAAIQHIHDTPGQRYGRVFGPSAASQAEAQDILKRHQLDAASVENLESKWSTATSRRWNNRAGSFQMERIVYQW